MEFNDILGVVSAVTGILSFIVSLVEARRVTKPRVLIIAVFILFCSCVFLGYLHFSRHNKDVPPYFHVSLNSVESTEWPYAEYPLTKESTLDIPSKSEHIKVILNGTVSGLDISTCERPFSVYTMVRPPDTQ